MGNDAKPIYFDSIDNGAYILGKASHSARNSWIYIDGEVFQGARADIGGDPKEPWLHIAWKYLYTAKDSWLGTEANLGAIGATYNLTMDPYEKYEVTFNGAAPARVLTTQIFQYLGSEHHQARVHEAKRCGICEMQRSRPRQSSSKKSVLLLISDFCLYGHSSHC